MNLDSAGLAIGWREAVIGLIVIVAAYMLFVLLRVRRLRQRQERPSATALEPGPAEPVPTPEPPSFAETCLADQAPGAAWQEAPSQLTQRAAVPGLDAEVAQLRDEVDALRGELAALRGELHAEIVHMRAAQTVSPIYSDAMQMATAGHDALTIAEHCGISRAEAELVVALVTSQNS